MGEKVTILSRESDIPYRGELLRNEAMAHHTSLKTGGPADYFAIPEDTDDLCALLVWLRREEIPFMTMGRGYNLLVRDRGIRGCVISLEKLSRITLADNHVVQAEAGAENLTVVRFAQQQGLGGISFISGIPGTIGGALTMNAGAYGQGILPHTERLTLLRNGAVLSLSRGEFEYGYRRLSLKDGDIVLAAQFSLSPCDAGVVEEAIRKDVELRRTKHNVGFPSAGSFFKNPSGQAAWKLIDAAGLRGTAVGGALVSEVHSNFLVNAGGATTGDFLTLAALIKKQVFAISGVTLEEEVRIVGKI